VQVLEEVNLYDFISLNTPQLLDLLQFPLAITRLEALAIQKSWINYDCNLLRIFM